MKICLTFFLILIINVSAGQITNIKVGVWSDTSVWSNNKIPADTANVILSYNIILDISDTCNSLNTNGNTVVVNSGINFYIGNSNIIVDIDGNIYKTVNICNQTWTSKNLEVSRYRNGDIIPQVTDAQWATLTTGAWCYYKNDPANGLIYGKLYNWAAVNDPRGLAPKGWHIPGDSEWTALANCLGGQSFDGYALKEIGTSHWHGLNNGATNSSGFTALPGGFCSDEPVFYSIGTNGFWWSSTEINVTNAINRYLSYNDATLETGNYNKLIGYSVRCIKD